MKNSASPIFPLIAKHHFHTRLHYTFADLKPGAVTHKFNDLMKRINLTAFKLHSLRHTFATRLVAAGVDILAVKELLGHQDIRTSMVYAKADTETLRRAVEVLMN